MKTREQNRNNNRNNIQTEIERFDWFVERIQTRVAFGWLSFMPEELSRNRSILRFDVILQHDWPIEQCLLHIRVFFGGKTKRPCFDLFIHWLIKQITNLTETIFQGHTKIALKEKLRLHRRLGSVINCTIGLLWVALGVALGTKFDPASCAAR